VLLRNHNGQNALEKAVASNTDECIDVLVKHVSLIMEALRVAIMSGDAAVAAVVRSVESRNQGLDYGDLATPLVEEAEAVKVGPTSTIQVHSPSSVVEADYPAQRPTEDLRPQPLSTQSHHAASAIPLRAVEQDWGHGIEPSTFMIHEPPVPKRDDAPRRQNASVSTISTMYEAPEPVDTARPEKWPSMAARGPVQVPSVVNRLPQEDDNVPRPSSPAIRRKPAPSSASPEAFTQAMAPAPPPPPSGIDQHVQKIMAYPLPPQAYQQLPTPPYTQYTPSSQDQGRFVPAQGYQGWNQGQSQSQSQSQSQGSLQPSPQRPQLRQYQAYQPSSESPPRQMQQQQQQQQMFPSRDNRASFQAMPPPGQPAPLRTSGPPAPVRPGLQQGSGPVGSPNMPVNSRPPPQQSGYVPSGNYDDRPRRPQQRMSSAASSSSTGYPGGVRPGNPENYPGGPAIGSGLQQRPSFPPSAPVNYPSGSGPAPRPQHQAPYDPKYQGSPPTQPGPQPLPQGQGER
jgi:hypothetical protein